jgi:hypothetical protein
MLNMGFVLLLVLLFVGSVGVTFALLVIGYTCLGLSGCLLLFLQATGCLDYHKIHTASMRADGLPGLPGPGEALKLEPVPKRGDNPPARAYPYNNNNNNTWGCTIDGWKPQTAISMTGPNLLLLLLLLLLL